MPRLTVNSMEATRAAMLAQDGSVGRSLRGLSGELRGSTNRAAGAASSAPGRERLARQRVNELVGQTFYGTLLKTMRSSSLKASYGHGGRGEEVFQGQLDMLLAQRMGQAKQFKLNDAIYRSLMKGVTAKGTAPSTGTQSPQAAWSPTGRRAERGNAERDCPLPSGGETR